MNIKTKCQFRKLATCTLPRRNSVLQLLWFTKTITPVTLTFSRDLPAKLAELANVNVKGNRLFWQLPVKTSSCQQANSLSFYNEKSRSKVYSSFSGHISVFIVSKTKLRTVTASTFSVVSRWSAGNVVLRSGASRTADFLPKCGSGKCNRWYVQVPVDLMLICASNDYEFP